MTDNIESVNDKEIDKIEITWEMVEKFLKNSKIRFTADEIKSLIDEGELFYESELHEIMDLELERDMEDMDTDVVDVCAWAIVNGLYLEG